MTPPLIERLQAAEGGSRELDILMARVVGGTIVNGKFERVASWGEAAAVTTSFDAALALVEEKLPDWKYIDYAFDRDDPVYRHQIVLHKDKHKAGAAWVNASHPNSYVLCVLIALLKALKAHYRTL